MSVTVKAFGNVKALSRIMVGYTFMQQANRLFLLNGNVYLGVLQDKRVKLSRQDNGYTSIRGYHIGLWH